MVDNASYIAKDKQFLSPALNRAFSIVAEKASGSYIYDVEGNAYLDFTSGIAVNQVGHAHPEVVKAIAEQAALCIHTSCVTHYPSVIELGEKLASIMPGNINCTFFSNSGAEAIDGAIKLAKLARPGRTNFIVHKGGFHGRSIGGTSLTTSKSIYKRYYEPLLPGIHSIEYPNVYAYESAKERADYEKNLGHELQRLFDTTIHPETVAAIFIEPIMGEGGYIPAPASYLKHLREVCDKNNILLIFDEVQCGMGRTGKWFASEHYGIVPDIQIMAKGLSGGIPLGAFAASKELMSQMPPASHGSTFGGNPVSCKAALKLIEIIERDKVLASVNTKGEKVFEFFAKHYSGSDYRSGKGKASSPVRLRGLGLMIGLEFDNADIVTAVKKHCFDNKLLLLGCGTYANTIRLAPDLTVSDADLTKGLEIMHAAIQASLK